MIFCVNVQKRNPSVTASYTQYARSAFHTKGFSNEEFFIIIVTISDFYQHSTDRIIDISGKDFLICGLQSMGVAVELSFVIAGIVVAWV